jgi:hypothetical protein
MLKALRFGNALLDTKCMFNFCEVQNIFGHDKHFVGCAQDECCQTYQYSTCNLLHTTSRFLTLHP